MSKLLSSSNSAIVKYQKSSVVNSGKFLNAKTKTTGVGGNLKKDSPKFLGSQFFNIEKKVIQIDKILKDSLLLFKKEEENKRKGKEKEKFEGKEKQLESKKPPKVKGIKLPSLPKMGFLSWVKNFITQTILGFFAVRLIEFLPQLLKVLPVIIKVSDFFIAVGGKLLDGLVTFIDWGYKAYDATRGFAKNLFGESGVKQFDQLSGLLNKFLNLAIIAGMVAAGSGGFGKGGGAGAGAAARPRPGQGGRPKVTTSGGRGLGRPDIRNPLRRRPTVTTGDRKGRFRLPGTGPRITGTGAKGILSTVRPLLKRIPLPVIGALIDFGLSVALGENPGRAAFRAIGAGLLGAVGAAAGSVVPIAGNFIGGLLGGYIGDTIGGALYDAFFGSGVTPKKQKGIKAAGGGRAPQTSSRSVKKKKKSRSISFTARKIKPGANTGGEDKIQKLFPNPEKPGGMFGFLGGMFGGNQQKQETKKTIEKSANPQEFLIKSNDVLGRTDFFGPFFTLAIKTVLGQKPDVLDYKNAGRGLNTWMQSTFKSGSLGFAGGGEVNIKHFFAGEDYSDVIAKSVEDSVSKEVDVTIRDLAKELSLRPVGREEMIQQNIEKDKETIPDLNIDMGSGGTVTGGNADFWTLVAISRMEDSDPQGSADVAQSIYNRVASGIYGGKSIKQIVLRNGQYEPTWKYPKRGKTGIPNPEWHAIKDLASASAATGISQSDLQKTASALRNPKYQEEARKFVGGRTDFMGGGNKKGAEDVQRTTNAPNNFFGWFVGPAAIAYGKKNPGPANAPQLGDIVVMGGGGGAEPLGKGYGSAGSKIAGELGRYIKKKLRQGPDFSQVHRHPEHPPYSLTSGHSKGSLHYQGRAIDIGAYTREQGPILKVISEFNKMKGVRPVELLHGRNEPSGHSNHVHAAYERGGETLDGPHFAMLGEKGVEFVIDADSTAALEGAYPGFLDALNKAKYKDAIRVLQSYTDYEQPEPEVVFIPVPTSTSGGESGGTSKPFLTYDYSTIDTMGEQMSDNLMYG